ncbi:uncharacterized protein LOC116412684 [Galleria mellonella]|uniref:Uncharacterized protein LOC116412684 n=1 Tax=Galleria mellonella TaxID=7137 RepID=A0ABM3MAD1_GALME|nr:uncharacterized protein LOC116412684 [Galleria mellonella]
MTNFFIYLSFINIFSFGCYYCVQVKHERALIQYYNKKYVSHAQAFTGRAKRREPYRTNITITTLHTWQNNVTIKLIYKDKQSASDFYISVKLCDAAKFAWIIDYVSTYADFKVACPFPPSQ